MGVPLVGVASPEETGVERSDLGDAARGNGGREARDRLLHDSSESNTGSSLWDGGGGKESRLSVLSNISGGGGSSWNSSSGSLSSSSPKLEELSEMASRSRSMASSKSESAVVCAIGVTSHLEESGAGQGDGLSRTERVRIPVAKNYLLVLFAF